MNYQEAFNYINSFTNYEKAPGLSDDLSEDGLQRVQLLMRLLGRPQNSFKSIIVAGTKGKGSVAAMLESVLREAGYTTGLYTSPHLHTFRERIRVGGVMIYPNDMARITASLVPVVERIRALGDPSLLPTTYELATAIAFLYFQER
ncbi:MAG: bifunctional folylpolyglutamate synthase/dihydrofolate synthase, partial [Chloroflexia bacterium]